jgi:FdhD protein
MPAEQSISYTQYKSGRFESVSGGIIVERPVSLHVNGRLWLTFMCTPIDVEALAVGFLFTEGVLEKKEELQDVSLHPKGHMVEVWLNKDAQKPENWRFTSGCAGGVVSADKNIKKVPLVESRLAVDEIVKITAALLEHQGLYESVGGVHTSTLFNGPEQLIVCEDIGRHNTMDKLAGKMFLDQINGENLVIATSGRVSSEMLQKAASMGVSVVISRTSPTSLSIQLAEEYQITLVGYARGKKFSIYTHAKQIANGL